MEGRQLGLECNRGEGCAGVYVESDSMWVSSGYRGMSLSKEVGEIIHPDSSYPVVPSVTRRNICHAQTSLCSTNSRQR